MNKPYNEEANKTLDEIINKRRSIRKFKKEVPPKEIIEDIIKSGLMAPYAGISGIPVNEILTETMSKNKDFANLLELPYGEFELDGCAIGYPDQIPLEKRAFLSTK